LGFSLQGFVLPRAAAIPFRRPMPSWRFTSQRQRPRPMTAGAVSRRGPWFPRVLTARSPSRLCSARGARIHRVAVRPCDGSEPSWVSASLGSSPPPKQHGQMPHPPPSSFPPARSLAGPCRRRSTAFRLSAEVAFSLSRVPALPRFLPLAASPIWNVRSRWVIDSPKPRGSVSLPLPGFFCETVAPTGARRGCL
jgi:hypothetical protein